MGVLQRAVVADMLRPKGHPERDGFRAVDSPDDEISLSSGSTRGRAAFLKVQATVERSAPSKQEASFPGFRVLPASPGRRENLL